MTPLKTIRIEEAIRSNSFPFPSLGEDFEDYFVKFPVKGVDNIDLIYEVVCKHVGDHFGIPIPAITIMSAAENSWKPSVIPELKSGLVGFASRKVSNSDLLSRETGIIGSKHDYNRFENPLDLLRIGLFDFHISNQDRSEENFNLIIQYSDKDKIIAIDHVAAFGGNLSKGMFRPRIETGVGRNLMKSDFGRSMLHYINQEQRDQVILEYEARFNNLTDALNVAFKQVPSEWELSSDLKSRIVDFLTNSERNQSVIDQFNRLLRLL